MVFSFTPSDPGLATLTLDECLSGDNAAYALVGTPGVALIVLENRGTRPGESPNATKLVDAQSGDFSPESRFVRLSGNVTISFTS